MRSRVPHPFHGLREQRLLPARWGNWAQVPAPISFSKAPLDPQPFLNFSPQRGEDWSGSRPRSSLSLLTTEASWALKQGKGQGADERKEDQWLLPPVFPWPFTSHLAPWS